MSTRRFTFRQLLALLLILGLAALQITAFHWGVITPDTVDQFQQTLSGHYDDWHPPITAWIWHLIIKIYPGSAGILIFNIVLYWFGFGLFGRRLLREGKLIEAFLIIAIGALPIPFGQMGSILKDPFLLALCLVGAALITDPEGGPVSRLAALLVLIVATAVRFNALFATLPLAIAMLPPGSFRTWPRRAAAVALPAMILIASTWLINVAALQPHRSEPIFSLVNFDLGGIAAHGDGNPYPSMSDAETRQMTALCYTPGLYNPQNSDACSTVEDGLRDYAHAHGVAATAIWFQAVSNAPFAYIAHRLDHLNQNWRFLLRHVPADAVYMMSEPNDIGLQFTPNALTVAIVKAAQAMAWSPLGRPATWIAVAIALLLGSARFPSRDTIRVLSISALLYGAGYAAVSVAPDMRYNLWTMTAVMIASVFALGDFRRGARPPRKAAYAGLALILGAVAGELIALV